MIVKERKTMSVDYTQLSSSKNVPIGIRILKSYIKFLYKINKKKAGKFVTNLFFKPQRKKLSNQNMKYYDTGISTKIYYNKEEIFVFEKGIGTETILVVHGWGSSSYRMRAIIDILVSSGYRVITFDQPAHGLSTGKQTNIVEITDIIFHLEQKYGAFYAAIGHSFGGASLFYALKRGFHLNKIITISSSTRMDNLIRTFGILLSIPPELEAYIVERIEKITGHPYNEISSSNMILSKDIEYYIFHDRDDQMVPYQDSVILQNNNPQIKLTFTEGDGHRGILKNNEVQDQIIQFLSETVLISIK